MASPEGGALVPPHRRKGGAPDLNYELRPNKFTVAMHHGGFFCGIGTNRAYIDGKLDFFDECDNQTWSQDSIDNMLNQLGYPASWLEHVYWLEPGYGMAHGLRTMNFQRDATKVAESSLCCKI
uniref:Uncharacterized protein n=1 Tax=Avena sativa TaxID=4498 RepID=A0ACD5XVY2_AVESA